MQTTNHEQTKTINNFRNITDLDFFSDNEKKIIYYIKKLITADKYIKIKEYDIYLNFNTNEFNYYFKDNKLFLKIPLNISYYELKFEIYKIDYLLKYQVARSIYSIYPNFYKIENIRNHIFYILGFSILFILLYVLSGNFLGILIITIASIFIIIYFVFLINLIMMTIYIWVHSRCFNDVCPNRSWGKYCIACELYIRKNPFILLNAPKIIFLDQNYKIEPEIKLLLYLIIAETEYLKNFYKILINFNVYDKYKIINPFTIKLILNRNKSLKDFILDIFNFDIYLCEKNPKTRRFISFYDIPKFGTEKTEKFIQKYDLVYRIINVLNMVNKKLPEIPTYNILIDYSSSIEEKIINIAKLKLEKLKEIDRELAELVIKKLNNPIFDYILN